MADIEQLRDELAEAAKHQMAATVLIEKLREQGAAVPAYVLENHSHGVAGTARALLRMSQPELPPPAIDYAAEVMAATRTQPKKAA